MRKSFDHIDHMNIKTEGGDGLVCHIKCNGVNLQVIASWGGGWDHVSVSLGHRCPTWGEMCFIKDKFWEPEETVMQIHPAKSAYVNKHPYCLHMWRPHDEKIPLPPKEFVG